MKILFFSDLHGDMKALAALKKKSIESDMIGCAGDISTMENNLPFLLSQINDFRKPSLIIPGNHENEERLRKLCSGHRNLIYLHRAVHHIGDYVFIGYGGDGFSVSDSDFERISSDFFSREVKGKKRIILITHGPPFKTEIDKIGQEYRGNRSYRKFIDTVKPHLVISGHLHENAGKHHRIGRTLLINPGKEGAIVNI